ncbi:MAG: c-type cytochrome [Balneolaceae bacterium]
MMKRDYNYMTLTNRTSFAVVLLASMMLASCRGQISEKPPVHPQQNMDFQNRFEAQEENPFFEDGRAMRAPVEGTVARGQLREDHELYEGVDENGDFVEQIPVELTEELLFRGKNRYDIYCAVCHGGAGDGQGIIMAGGYGYVPAPSFHQDRIREMPDGEIYSAIYNGVRTMPSYATQIKPEDRWAIVSYVRALQQSQNASAELVASLGGNPQQLLREAQEAAAAAEAEQESQAAEDGADEAASDSAAGDEGGNVSAELGQQLFTRQGCQACHSVDGSPGVGPSLAGLYGQQEHELEGGETVVVDDAYLHESIVEPGVRIAAGYQNMMTPYGHLSENEIQSLIEYIKTLADE